MIRKAIITLLLLLTPFVGYAQTQTTVIGDILGATSGYVEFRLMPWSTGVQYFVSGGPVIAQQTVRCSINGSGEVVGLLSGACLIWGNPSISPGNTTYQVVYFPNGRQTNSVARQLISGLTYDLSDPTFAPVVNLVPQYNTVTTNPINANVTPAADKVFNLGTPSTYYAAAYIDQLFANSFNGSINFPVDVDFKTTNNIRHCDQFDGATAGAKIAACIDDLPSAGGTADARGLEGAQTISQNMFSGVSKPVTLLLGAATITMSVSQVLPTGTQIFGLGHGATIINYNQASGSAIDMTNALYVRLNGFKLAATSGSNTATGLYLYTTWHSNFDELRIDAFGTNIKISGVPATASDQLRSFNNTFTGISSTNYTVCGICIDHAVDTRLTDTMNWTFPANPTSARAMIVDTGVSGLHMQTMSIIGGGIKVQNSTPSAFFADLPPEWIFGDQVIVDTVTGMDAWEFDASLGVPDAASRTGKNYRFTTSWAAFTQTNGTVGINIEGGDIVVFENCLVRVNRYHGILISGGIGHRFVNCTVIANNQQNAADGDGARVAANVTNFEFSGGLYADDFSESGHQEYGIRVSTGSSANYIISDLRAVNNDTGDIFDGGGGVHIIKGISATAINNGGGTILGAYDRSIATTGRIELGDGGFFWEYKPSGANTTNISFDADDYLQYNRTGNIWSWYINNVVRAQLDSSGTGARFYVGSDGGFYLDYKVADSNAVNLSFDTNDYLNFARNTNQMQATIGSENRLQVDTTNDATDTGIAIFHNGSIKRVKVHTCVTGVDFGMMTTTTATCLGF